MTSDPMLPANSPARGTTALPLSPIEQLCAAIRERLKAELPGNVTVDFFPDRPEEYDFEGYEAAALVLYDGSTFDQSGQLGAQGLSETVRLHVALLVRSLRGPSGAYGLIHAVRLALHGYRLAGGTGLRPLEAGLERQDEQVFQYRLMFETRLVSVPAAPATGRVVMPRSFQAV